MSKKFVKTASASIVGIALCFSSTVAVAATAPVAATYAPMSISPFVALSAYGTMQSRSAVCASAVGAAGVAAAGQAATPGCVLPVADPVVPVAVEAAPVGVAPVAVAAGTGIGLGIGALLAGLVLVAGLAAVLLSDNDEGRLPISPE